MIQTAELHFDNKQSLDSLSLQSNIEKILGEEVIVNTSDKGVLSIAHKNHIIGQKDGVDVCAHTCIMFAEQPIDLTKYKMEVGQSWRCRNAVHGLHGSTNSLLVSEIFARPLPPAERLQLFHGVLQALLQMVTPNALVFKHSQQVVDAESYLRSCKDDPFFRHGSVNVRLFKIETPEGDLIMDTRGLEEIGLHDLQCHYRNLPPNTVSGFLYNMAAYIFENGPVIESGHTVDGPIPDSVWRCQFEESILEPKRTVLDFDPGDPYASGNRERSN